MGCMHACTFRVPLVINHHQCDPAHSTALLASYQQQICGGEIQLVVVVVVVMMMWWWWRRWWLIGCSKSLLCIFVSLCLIVVCASHSSIHSSIRSPALPLFVGPPDLLSVATFLEFLAAKQTTDGDGSCVTNVVEGERGSPIADRNCCAWHSE